MNIDIGKFPLKALGRAIPWIAGIVGLDLATGKGLDFFGLIPRHPKETAAALQQAAKPMFAPQSAEKPTTNPPQAPAVSTAPEAPAVSTAPEAPVAPSAEIPDAERSTLQDELKRCYAYDKLLDEKIAAVTGDPEKYSKIAGRAALEMKKIDGEIAEKKAALGKMENTYKSAADKGGTFAEQWTKVKNELIDKISALELKRGKENWIMDTDKLNWLQAEKARHAKRIAKLEEKLGIVGIEKPAAAMPNTAAEEKPSAPPEESVGPEKPAAAASSNPAAITEKPTTDIPEWFDIASAEFAKTIGGKGYGQLYVLKDKNGNFVDIQENAKEKTFTISFCKAGESEGTQQPTIKVTSEIAAKLEPAVSKACSGKGASANAFLKKFHALIKEAPVSQEENAGEEDVLDEIPLEDEPKQSDSSGGKAKPGDINV